MYNFYLKQACSYLVRRHFLITSLFSEINVQDTG
jgi:hypothetical protein